MKARDKFELGTAAALGADLLDRKSPGWHWRVDLETLALHRMDHCVLGQLYGNYLLGCDALGLTPRYDTYDLGFSRPTSSRYVHSPVYPIFHLTRTAREYRVLDEAWTTEIQRRRERTSRETPELVACG